MRILGSGPRRRLLWASLLTAVAGCSGQDEGDGIEREALSGKVTFGGAPLAKASIQFLPANAQAGGGTSGSIEAGEFHIPKERGAAVGGYKVLISSTTSDEGTSVVDAPGVPTKPRPDPIPKRYNVDSTLNAEVKAGGPNEFTFDLDSK